MKHDTRHDTLVQQIAAFVFSNMADVDRNIVKRTIRETIVSVDKKCCNHLNICPSTVGSNHIVIMKGLNHIPNAWFINDSLFLLYPQPAIVTSILKIPKASLFLSYIPPKKKQPLILHSPPKKKNNRWKGKKNHGNRLRARNLWLNVRMLDPTRSLQCEEHNP